MFVRIMQITLQGTIAEQMAILRREMTRLENIEPELSEDDQEELDSIIDDCREFDQVETLGDYEVFEGVTAEVEGFYNFVEDTTEIEYVTFDTSSWSPWEVFLFDGSEVESDPVNYIDVDEVHSDMEDKVADLKQRFAMLENRYDNLDWDRDVVEKI